MNKEHEIEFYKGLAKEIKSQGFRCFLYNKESYAWLYVITPNNSLLYIDNGEFGGFNIIYEYKPSKEFGSGCRYNDEALHEITAKTLVAAEQYGKSYGHQGWIKVSNIYDGKSHRENVWKSPEHYGNAYKAMMQKYSLNDLIEL